MLRSGLAMAGADTWLRAGNPPEVAEDGLLTAEDVTGLDMVATELVVLSACETGLGQIHVGEGVFGLRRAFVLAGTKTLVMSLWKVPDERDPRADGGLLRPPPGRRGPRRGVAPSSARDEGEIPRPVLLGRLHLPGRSFTPARGGIANRANSRLRRLTVPRNESVEMDLEVVDVADPIADHEALAIGRQCNRHG